MNLLYHMIWSALYGYDAPGTNSYSSRGAYCAPAISSSTSDSDDPLKSMLSLSEAAGCLGAGTTGFGGGFQIASCVGLWTSLCQATPSKLAWAKSWRIL
jgi:hypothetical protein